QAGAHHLLRSQPMPLMSARTSLRSRLTAFALAALGLTIVGAIPAQAQQAPAAARPTPCIGYVYNARPARMVAGGVQTVAEVLPETPAEAVGLQAGDVLVSIAGVPPNHTGPGPTLIPGDTIEYVVSRAGRNVTLTMVVEQREPVPSGDPV